MMKKIRETRLESFLPYILPPPMNFNILLTQPHVCYFES